MRSSRVKNYGARVAAHRRRISELQDEKKKLAVPKADGPEKEAPKEDPYTRLRRRIDEGNQQK